MARQSRIAEAYVQIVPSMNGFGSSLDKALANVGTGSSQALGDKTGKAFSGSFGSSLKSGLQTATKVAFAAAGVAAVAGGAYIVDSIKKAANFADIADASSKIFGNAQSDIEQFASTSVKNFGISKTAAMEASYQMGVLGQSAGLTGKDNAKFSTSLVGLAGDLSAFSGKPVEQALGAVSAALRGEMEPIRAFGITLDDFSLRQKALAMGITTTTKEALTPQQKILATNALLWEKGGFAVGNFADTADSAVGQAKILTGSFDDLSTQLGTALLPLATKIVTFLNENFIPAFSDFVKEFEKGNTPLNTFFDVFSNVINFVMENSGLLISIGTGILAIVAAFQALSVAMSLYSVAAAFATAGTSAFGIALAATGIGAIIIAIGLLIAGIVYLATQTTFFQDVWAGLVSFFKDSIANVSSFFKGFGEGITKVFKGIGDFVGSVFKGIGNYYIGFINFIIKGINAVIGLINSINIPIPEFARGLFGGAKKIGFNLSLIREIPQLATGGDVMGSATGTTVVLGDKNKAETVTNLGQTNDFIAQTLQLVKNANAGGAGATPVINMTVNPSQGMSEAELAKKVVTQLRREMRR